LRSKRPCSRSFRCPHFRLSQTGVMPINGKARGFCDFGCAVCKAV
jgi:hypothetical protein